MNYTEKRLEEFDEAFHNSSWWEDAENNKHSSAHSIRKFLSTSIAQALAEDRERVVGILDEEVMWYNTNNQIPDSELGKSEEHWEMLRKIVNESLKEVATRTRTILSSLDTNNLKK